LTSKAKAAANRTNGARSTGPRTCAGKARASRNAFRHGFSVASNRSSDLARRLAVELDEAGDSHLLQAAEEFVAAEIELNRIRQHRAHTINLRVASWVVEIGSSRPNHAVTNLIYAAALVQNLELLTTVERYERRAWSRRNRALRALAERASVRPFAIQEQETIGTTI
jgi:hypothetical protein